MYLVTTNVVCLFLKTITFDTLILIESLALKLVKHACNVRKAIIHQMKALEYESAGMYRHVHCAGNKL